MVERITKATNQNGQGVIKTVSGKQIVLQGVHDHGWVDSPQGSWIRRNGANVFANFDVAAINDEMEHLRQLGVNVFRVFDAMASWRDDLEGHRGYVKRFLDICNQKGIYVIFSFYTTFAGSGTHPVNPFAEGYTEADFVQLWASVAEELGQYPNVIFDLFNEARADKDAFFDACQGCIAAIRAKCQNMILIQWGYAAWLNLSYPIPENRPENPINWVDDSRLQGVNVGYTTHQYENHIHRSPNANVWNYAESYEDTKLFYDLVYMPVINKGKVLILGEVGRPVANIEGLRNTLKVANEYGISWVAFWWYNATKYALLDGSANYGVTETGKAVLDAITQRKPVQSSAVLVMALVAILVVLVLMVGGVKR